GVFIFPLCPSIPLNFDSSLFYGKFSTLFLELFLLKKIFGYVIIIVLYSTLFGGRLWHTIYEKRKRKKGSIYKCMNPIGIKKRNSHAQKVSWLLAMWMISSPTRFPILSLITQTLSQRKMKSVPQPSLRIPVRARLPLLSNTTLGIS